MSLARTVVVAAVIFAALAAPPGPRAQTESGTIEKIHTQGNIRMSDRALLEALGVKVGDPFNQPQLVSAFRTLWDRGLFTDIVMEVEDCPPMASDCRPGGKVLIVKVVERPTLASVTYQDNKVLTQTAIEDRLIELKQRLELGQPLDMKKVFIVESTIRDMLAEKGFLEAKVAAEPREETEQSYSVHFFIQPGGKTRIKKIEFAGNEIFKDKQLRGQLELTTGRKWYWPWSSKNLYHPVKWDQDSGAVSELYQNAGYLDVEIRPPIIEPIPKKKKKKKKRQSDDVLAPDDVDVIPPKKINKIVKAQTKLDKAEQHQAQVKDESPPDGLSPKAEDKWYKKQRKRENKAEKRVTKAKKGLGKAEKAAQPEAKQSWVILTVPVVEGQQYTTGVITVEGSTVYEAEQLIALIPLREGFVLSAALLKLGIDRITRLYGDRGYLYANVVRQIKRRPEGEPVADVLVSIEEDEAYFVDVIEFEGNTNTTDKVLRREFRLLEGELFSQTKLDLSMRKINQLGYVASPQDPVIEPLEGENRVRILVPVEEQGRNEIQVGGGFSGSEGAFFTGFYSTRNFLGRGQILTVSMQIGGRTSRYGVSFIEPWFAGKPVTLGFTLFSRTQDFGVGLRSEGRGGGIILGKQLGNFTAMQLNYNYESVQSTGFTVQESLAVNRISSLTPSVTFNKINNPYRPSRGYSLQGQVQIAGGVLGGDSSYYRPVFTYTAYRPGLMRKAYFAFHGQVGLVRAYGDGTTSNTSTVAEIPRFQRFWLGGETIGPRVFETRTITPLRFVRVDSTGQIVEFSKNPVGRRVEDFDRNNDGILNQFDLVEIGGDRMYLAQQEWVYPLNEQLDIALFLDIGNALAEDTTLTSVSDTRVSTGIEVRFHLPVFPVPLRLLYGVPIRSVEFDRTSNFTFSLGRSF